MSVYERVALLTGAPFLRYLQSKKESAQTLFFVRWRQRVMHGRSAVESCGRADRLYSQSLEKAVREVVRPVLEGSGYSLVDLTIARLSGSTRVNVVIYRKEGVGVDDCAAVSGMLFPRLETLEALPDPSLEVSSPGVDRMLRHPEEYTIFQGKGIRVLAGRETEWVAGVIDRVDEGTLWLKKGKESRGFALSEIRKARLDYSAEVEEARNAV